MRRRSPWQHRRPAGSADALTTVADIQRRTQALPGRGNSLCCFVVARAYGTDPARAAEAIFFLLKTAIESTEWRGVRYEVEPIDRGAGQYVRVELLWACRS